MLIVYKITETTIIRMFVGLLKLYDVLLCIKCGTNCLSREDRHQELLVSRIYFRLF